MSKILNVSRVSINRYLMELRRVISEHCESSVPEKKYSSGDVELDESYFGSRRKGMRGRGALDKIIVFGLLKRGGNVLASIVPDVSKNTLLPIVKSHVDKNVSIHTDDYPTYKGLRRIGYKRHRTVNHSLHEYANKKSHINGIEGFWGYAKNRLVKFNGVPQHVFNLHLKECEFRYNMRNKDIYHEILKMARKRPLFSKPNQAD